MAATLFYLLCYGVMNAGAFAVLACLERPSKDGMTGEIDEIDDLRGLWKSHRVLAVAMALSALSLLGLPPLLGFFGKLGLFTSAIASNEIALVVVLGLNSAIAAFYYLRVVAAAYLDPRDEERTADIVGTPFTARPVAALLSAGGVVALVVVSQPLVSASLEAATYRAPTAEDVGLAELGLGGRDLESPPAPVEDPNAAAGG
ncbi:MAG: proton-conducting transporter membrane subunit [Planctomycetota bacterium]